MPKPLMFGKTERMSFSMIDKVVQMPDLLEIQKSSYEWFIKEGLKEAFDDISPIEDYSKNLSLEFIDYELDKEPKYSIEESKERDVSYSVGMKVQVRLRNKETGEMSEQLVTIGDFPLMTPNGTFIINGAERVIVSQLVRSPGPYYDLNYDKVGSKLFSSTIIPNRGAWLEYETDSNDTIAVRIDRTRKLPATSLIRAIGYQTDHDIISLFGEDEKLLKTLEKDSTSSLEEGMIEIYKKLRPSEPPSAESAKSLITSLFFDPKRYDLARVGRHKFNKKLGLADRIHGRVASDNVIDPNTGELLAEKGQKISKDLATIIENSGVKYIEVYGDDERIVRVIGNHFVDISAHLDKYPSVIKEKVYYPVLKEIMDKVQNEEELQNELELQVDRLVPKCITPADIIASFSYILNLPWGIGSTDDIDHLGNRRIRAVGELLQNQFRIGLTRMERVVRERMTIQDMSQPTANTFINTKPVVSAIKEFFGSSQLSQFMDQTNPLAELAHKRKLSALGPGGLSRERAGFEVRDVHHSHYGRMCPIESPEGPNIGLIASLATFARINEYGFIESPYRVIDKEKGIVTDEIRYITADIEETSTIVTAKEPLDSEGRFINSKLVGRRFTEITEFPASEADFMEVSAQQMVSVATAMIPFLENDDSARALMGSNMQRQAVPLVVAQAPIVGTGIEHTAAKDSGSAISSDVDGVIEYVSADEIVVLSPESKKKYRYKLLKFKRSNQGTCINHKPIVKKGQTVSKGEIIADCSSIKDGEIAIGTNLLVGYMNWEGYNYEDAIMISEELVMDDRLSSIHIEEFEIEARDTKLGPEEITRDIPNIGEDSLRNLDAEGIVRIGAEVNSGDILVGKVTPKGETELSAEEKLLRAIFGEKAREVRDTSLKVPHGESGIVVDVKRFDRENSSSTEMSPGVNRIIRVYVAKKRKINVGDKMSGRHGNKGVISKISPVEDMPFLEDGTPLQVCLNPLGVPSRMNIGQVLEVHMGLAASKLGWKVATPVFDGAKEAQIREALVQAGLPSDGCLVVRDGRTGEEFDNPVTVGYMYMLKLHHLVDDKIHARSVGPYSLVTQQPLGGKAQFGGQRFGEMEVWALEAYGAAHTLQEILTVKSDDVVGRVKAYEAIVKGEFIPEPGIPESFKVLIKELQALALDVKVLKEDEGEILIGDDYYDDDLDYNTAIRNSDIVNDLDDSNYVEIDKELFQEDEDDDDLDFLDE